MEPKIKHLTCYQKIDLFPKIYLVWNYCYENELQLALDTQKGARPSSIAYILVLIPLADRFCDNFKWNSLGFML